MDISVYKTALIGNEIKITSKFLFRHGQKQKFSL